MVKQPIDIFSDSLWRIVSWFCKEWWQALIHVFELRRSVCDTPFRIHWVPAHKLENVPDQLLTEEMAQAHNTTREHILHNKRADRLAKELAQLAPVNS